MALGLCFALCGACAQNNYSYTPPPRKNYTVDTSQASYSDKNFSLSISPAENYNNGEITGFILSVENKTKNDMYIVWNDSYYLNGNSPDGGFMFEGVTYSKRTEPKQDMIVLPNSTQNIHIFPNSKVYLMRPTVVARSVLPGGWLHEDLGYGEHGAYIMVKGKGINKRIKLLLSIS